MLPTMPAKICPVTMIRWFVLLGASLLLLSGCVIPRGSKTLPEEVVNVRTNTTGETVERLVGVSTAHHVFMPLSPEGPQLNYVNNYSWRYYLDVRDVPRKELRFLRSDSGGAQPWEILTPVPGTNLWAGAIYTGSLESHPYRYRVICFNALKIVASEQISFPRNGKLRFDRGKRRFVYDFTTVINSHAIVDGQQEFDPPTTLH
jgi:hypothetical protein